MELIVDVFLYALIGILKSKDFYKAIKEYFDFIQMFEQLQFHDIVDFLKNAMSRIFHNKEGWNNNQKHRMTSIATENIVTIDITTLRL